MRKVAYIYVFFAVLLQSFCAHAQADKALEEMRRGDLLRERYRFKEAAQTYASASEMFVDSLMTADDSLLLMDISDRILMAENGQNMMDVVYVPDVVARHRFSIDDFFLYYPLTEGTWRQSPSQLDSTAHEFSKATYVLDGEDVIYWSKEDKSGIRNIMHSVFQDSIWSAPALLNEHITSASDEIYPMLSSDRQQMYFSSKGLYGVGGYDIYVSDWDKESGDWSVPVNMGFPYSSPADDFLFINTDDGKYSVFASNRDCSKDSVWVYVIAYDDMPVRRAVSEPEEMVRIAELIPDDGAENAKDKETVAEADIPENVDTRRYMDKMSEIRQLRDSIDRLDVKVDDARHRNAEEEVLDGEMTLISLRDSLDRASAILQQIEMEFLFSGVVIDFDKLLAEADREIVGHTAAYEFTKREFGAPLSLHMQDPEPEFDYSFKILDEGQFAEVNVLPGGLIYQIQMFSSSSPATVAKLKGLSPVFQTKVNGKYVCRVGLFRTYADVLSHLNSVKRVGFRNAFIVAFHEGKEMKVTDARALEIELNKKPSLYEVRVETGKDELDMTIVGGIRQQSQGKDLVRTEKEDGTKVYVVGPFADKEAAEDLAGFIRAMGTSGATCVELPQ